MRISSLIVAAIAAFTIAHPAHADVQDVPNDWYLINISDDGSEKYYMNADSVHMYTRDGWTPAGILKTRAGASTADGVFATYNFVNINCADRTWAISDEVSYDASLTPFDKIFIDDDDEQFAPVDMDDMVGRIYKVTCHLLDPAGFPRTGPIMLRELVEKDTAAYKASH